MTPLTRPIERTGGPGTDNLPPLLHAYALGPDMKIHPGMTAYCGHVRAGAEGSMLAKLREPAAMCEVCRAMYPKDDVETDGNQEAKS